MFKIVMLAALVLTLGCEKKVDALDASVSQEDASVEDAGSEDAG